MRAVWVTILFSLCVAVGCEFTRDFNDYLLKHYGPIVRAQMERLDLGSGAWGSFGGKTNSSQILNKRPVVFVHGCMSRAASFLFHRDYYVTKGYSEAELYATSYGDGGKTFILDVPITCDIIKQTRLFITAVSSYTDDLVDVVASSMGSAVARKAILGGRCHDTREALGTPLTYLVDTFISLGGVNFGREECPLSTISCNNVSSMYCGSALLRELNSQSVRYEGKHSYAFYSLSDSIIGKECCGEVCGALRNADDSIEKKFLNHVTIMTDTVDDQLAALNRSISNQVQK